MKENTLKVICTLATGTAMIASMQTTALADNSELSNITNSSTVGYVTADVLNIRINPNTSSGVIGTLPYNTKVTILEISNGWYKINHNNNTGWISGEYVSLSTTSSNTSSSDAASSTGTVTADVLNVRSGAGTSYSVIGSLSNGAKVQISSTSNGWCKINYNGTTGFVSADYINTSSSSNSNNSSSTTDNSSNNSSTSSSNNSGSVGYVTADVLNVRSGNSTSHSVIGSLSNGAKVQILSTSNGWCKINYNGTTGFVSADYINASSSSNSNNSSNNSSNSNSNNSNTSVVSKGVITADVLNVRSGASTNSSIVGSLYNNDTVEITSTSNGWHAIKFKGSIAYVSTTYVNTSTNSGTITTPDTNAPSHTIDGKVAIVTADALNIRSGAGTSYSVISTVRYGYKLPIISYSNGWYQVQAGNTTGYVSGDYVSVTNESDTSTTNPLVKETPLIQTSYTGEDIASKAKEYIGVPYLWGGFTPMGFDCSGLVQYVYKQFGINLERTTYYQVHQGQVVEKSNLRAGDLIFFTTNDDDPNDISHVGMYVGNDLFIQAPKPGDTVRLSNLNSAYYSNRYYVAKRIIN